MTDFTEPSRFACNHCGVCCAEHRVPLTHSDLRRLEATAPVLEDIVEWLPADAVDMEGEPESFVELREGRRLLVLAHRDAEKGSVCVYWRDGRCQTYVSRPAACRTYPFELASTGPSARVHLAVHPTARCDRTTGIGAGTAGVYSADEAELAGVPPVQREAVVQALQERDRELTAYVVQVALWNRQQRRRRFGGHRPLARELFLDYLRACWSQSKHVGD